MSNLRYYNQSGPFWDFIAGLEGKDWSNHPLAAAFTGPTNQNNEANEPNEESETEKEEGEDAAAEAEFGAEENHPWGRGWGRGGFPFGGRGGRGRRERGPPGGFGRWGPPPPSFDGAGPSHGFEHPHRPHPLHEHHHGPPPPNEGEPQAPPPPEEEEGLGKGPGGPHHGPRGGPHRRDHGHHGHPGGHRGGPHARGGRGGCGARRGRGGPPGWGRGGNPFDMSNIAEFFQSQLFGGGEASKNVDGSAEATNGDFVPPVDIFDTESAFVIHVSLPGAKKEDIAVSWDADKSEVNITGIIHRPGDEEFLKTLALDERKVGAFERKVRLGSRANPAPVDPEGISAKLEDGILRLHVPKEDKEFDVIHKVDVE